MEGDAAVLALLRLTRGRFVLRADEAAVGARAMDASFTKLLLEHGRLADEARRS